MAIGPFLLLIADTFPKKILTDGLITSMKNETDNID
jgi:hypothetical protein